MALIYKRLNALSMQVNLHGGFPDGEGNVVELGSSGMARPVLVELEDARTYVSPEDYEAALERVAELARELRELKERKKWWELRP